MVHRTGRGDSGCGCLREICVCVCESAGRCCEGIADMCASCCRCTREKCSSCGESIDSFKTSCGDHCAECCQSIRNKCSGCTLFRETNNHDTNNGPTSDASGSPGDANIVTSQPTSVQENNVTAVLASDTSSSSSDSDWESDDNVASNNHVTPSLLQYRTYLWKIRHLPMMKLLHLHTRTTLQTKNDMQSIKIKEKK
ncbi:uncharacterized protein LOC128557034 [Mercenaria mercenaria]|uniref:uncharacterized protein LOC128557034 n=1 Tax=Mercenaria mercenaria TaxID=6596 RepID=UPI00234F501C|nr:uncharacterized protein LOC128557034 [Mercenaria mercenaria]